MQRLVLLALFVWLIPVAECGAERINQEGRILGALPQVTAPILFNTSNADAVVSAMQIFPVTNPWNEIISHLPVLTNSDAMIAQIISDLASNRQTLIAFMEMNYVLVSNNQSNQPIYFFNYPDESDLNGGTYPFGLYPFPTNQPVEGWPTQTGSQTLSQWQTNTGGDRHAIAVQPGAGLIYETWESQLTPSNWNASNGAIFNLNTNGLRTNGETSGDAAGFPMFPALVRYDEAERGMVEHACRLVVNRSRYNTYIYPATHFAAPSGNTSVNLPCMGQRLRLKSSFVIPASWTKEEKAVLLAFKKYGAMVADNGGFFSISVTPDDRWPSGCFDHFTSISITNFEVVQSTGPGQGPRSPGAPTASAGPDQSIAPGTAANLQGFVSYTGSLPVIQWRPYSGPGTVTFGDASRTNTTATFSAPGVYTLMLSADDSVHAVAYDALVITVAPVIQLSIKRLGAKINLTWSGGSPPYVVQTKAGLASSVWNNLLTTSVQSASITISNPAALFRIQAP